MARHLIVPSIRRSLITSVLALVIVTTVTMVVAFSVSFALHDEIDHDTDAFIEEQGIADDISALTYRQQIEGYHYLERPSPASRIAFRHLGDAADAEMRKYLLHHLSPAARLQVERMKETHDAFEVSAERAFDLAASGDVSAARRRLATLDTQTSTLDSAVDAFVQARAAQRASLQREYRDRAGKMRIAFFVVAALLLLLAAALVRHLQHRVLLPLEQLTFASQRIRSGDAHARVPPQRFAELRVMATAFNDMADGVQLSRETVEMQNEELRQSLDQLQETQEELVQHEKLSAMGQMLAGLAHELNNPLAAVLGMAEILRAELARQPGDAARRLDVEVAEPLQHEAMRARGLVRSLLSFARKPSGVLEPVSLAGAVNTAVGLRAHAFALAGKTIRVDVAQELHVMADAQKLQHGIVNVVNNALDAMIAEHGTGLRISAQIENAEMIRVDLDDDGPGFRDPRQAFTPFYTTKSADRGTGLGLALVQKFANEFGGTATASNRPGGGARVSLHLRRADAPDAASIEASVAAGADVSTDGQQAAVATMEAEPASALRVLVVDDEPSLREVQRRLLMLEGMDVLLASNAAEARTVLEREPVDLVISDLRMPGPVDGRGLLAWLETEHPALAHTAILVTGDASGADSADFPLPPERMINKPFSREEYVARVRSALGVEKR